MLGRKGVIINDATDHCIAPCIKDVNEDTVSRALPADGFYSCEQACGCCVCEVLIVHAAILLARCIHLLAGIQSHDPFNRNKLDLQVLIYTSILQAAQLLHAPHSKPRGLNATIQPRTMSPNAEQLLNVRLQTCHRRFKNVQVLVATYH